MIEAVVPLTGCQLPRERDRAGKLLHREHLQALLDLCAIDDLAVDILTTIFGDGALDGVVNLFKGVLAQQQQQQHS